MPAEPSAQSPQARFLLRGSVLLILFLVVWWFVLLNPLLILLRGSVEIFGGLIYGGAAHLASENAAGNWSFDLPREVAVPNPPPRSGVTQVHSIGFDIERANVISFTFSLPIFWALILAAPDLRRNGRALLWGTAAMAVLETVLVLMFVEISARNVVAQLAHSQSGFGKWALNFGDYLVEDVIPFSAPFLAVLWLHQELRWEIFSWGTSPLAEERMKTQSLDDRKDRQKKRRRAAAAR